MMDAKYSRALVPNGGDFGPRGHWTMSEDIFYSHNWLNGGRRSAISACASHVWEQEGHSTSSNAYAAPLTKSYSPKCP